MKNVPIISYLVHIFFVYFSYARLVRITKTRLFSYFFYHYLFVFRSLSTFSLADIFQAATSSNIYQMISVENLVASKYCFRAINTFCDFIYKKHRQIVYFAVF